ncbi:MAG: primase C-terminal domain-containing protein [Paludibacteraceae bacterium]|nr:primase C-terminal domain-containing protein [Paludibacteraceae bacterium]
MNINNIPEELKNLNQWVGVGIDSKVPMRVDTLYSASSTNPDTWCSFEKAKEAVKLGEITYPGFVFNDNGIVGIDIDDGYDEDGFMSELAADIIGKCASYTEKSKSGRGFHILLRGDLPFKGKNNLKGVEIYKTARYFIMTGDTLLYDTIVENQQAVDYIVDKYFPDMREGASDRVTTPRIYTPIWVKTEGKIGLRPEYPPIPDGTRNISLTSVAGQLHTLGYGKEEIYRELLYVNSVACKPQLDINEIQCIVNSVTRYKR